MKNTFRNLLFYCLLSSLSLLSQISVAQDLFSYYQGKKQVYYASDTKIIVRFKKEVNAQAKNQLLDKQLFEDIKNAENGFSFISLKAGVSKEQIKNLIKAYEQNDVVLSVSSLLLNEKREEIGALTEQFIVRLKANTSITQLSYFQKTNTQKIA